ncbi:MAG: RuBisCO large subunit C-terminal-like domain-containing protein [Methanomassiliicoccales archaeon]
MDPDRNVVCRYRITSELSMEKAAAAVATEQSTGTWTGISTLDRGIFERLSAKVVDIQGDQAVVAFPVEDFSLGVGGIPQILSVIAGNLFGLDALRGVRLEDVDFPEDFVDEFKGPKFGIEGMRRMLNRPEKPMVGTIVKPKIGLSPEKTAEYVYEAGMGGLTHAKDDETLVDQDFCPLEDRVPAIADAIDRVREETGHRMMHAINISSRGDRILQVAERAQGMGATELMVDVLTSGFAAIQVLAEDPSIKLPIHVHRTMHGAITRDPRHGIAMRVFAKLVRMSGGDALHVGTFGVGKMRGDPEEDLSNQGACVGEMGSLKPTLSVCSGGLHPGMVPELVRIAGKDIQVQAGGGVAGHPQGVRAGAMALSQAVDAATLGVPLEEYASDHPELEKALQRWGAE